MPGANGRKRLKAAHLTGVGIPAGTQQKSRAIDDGAAPRVDRVQQTTTAETITTRPLWRNGVPVRREPRCCQPRSRPLSEPVSPPFM